MRFLPTVSSAQNVALVIIIAWALAAVFMLTRTQLAASQIDRRVDTITNRVGAIDQDTDAVRLTQQTNETAAAILAAAEPLEGQLQTVIDETASIDDTAGSILDTAGSIGETVDAIRGTAGSINATAGDIDANLSGVLTASRSIDEGVAGINQRADRVIGLVRGIKADTGNTLQQVRAGVHVHANSIDCSGIPQIGGLVGGGGDACDSHR